MIELLLKFLGYQNTKNGHLALRIGQVFYTCLILLLLVSPIAVGIYNVSEALTIDPVIISLIIFTTIPFIQYCFGYRYFRQSHTRNQP